MQFSDFKGKIFTDITYNNEREELVFTDTENKKYIMYHEQSCCEEVYLEAVIGDFEDLLNTPIIYAYEDTKNGNDENESSTWTFYNLGTIKGSVNLRWYGTSNGYYSESVDIKEYIED